MELDVISIRVSELPLCRGNLSVGCGQLSVQIGNSLVFLVNLNVEVFLDLRLALSLVIIGLLEKVHGLSVFALLLSESSSEFLVFLVDGFDCVLIEMLLLKSELGRVVLFELRDLLL